MKRDTNREIREGLAIAFIRFVYGGMLGTSIWLLVHTLHHKL